MTLRALIWCAVSTVAQAEDAKTSLPKQESDARELCEREGWRIVDVLRVPGHSRAYIDIHRLAEDAGREGIDAFHKLLKHFADGDFDVLICRDSERFARSQSLHAYIVESIIVNGARLYSLADGWIDEHNFRMFISMAGYKAASDIDRLRKGRKAAMPARAARGLVVSSRTPLSHLTIRDALGNAIRTEVNESKRRLWNDLAALILEGVSWSLLEHELFARFGHVDSTGRPYNRNFFYTLVMNPLFWGHTVVGYRTIRRGAKSRDFGLWVFDESEAPPEGVQVFRYTVPPVYEGEMAERIKAEITRRHYAITGHATSKGTYPFTGLFVCGRCGGTMANYINNQRHERGLRCNYAHKVMRGVPQCDAKKRVGIRYVETYINGLLEKLIEGSAPDIFLQADAQPGHAAQLEDVEADIAVLEKQIGRLIYEQSLQPESAQDYYRKMVSATAGRLEGLKQQQAQLTASVRAEQQTAHEATRAIEELRAIGLQAFWKLPDGDKNRLLHRLFGKRRLVILDKQVVAVTTAKKRGAPKRERE